MGLLRAYDDARLIYLAHHKKKLYILLVSASFNSADAYWQLPGGRKKKEDYNIAEETICRNINDQFGINITELKNKIFYTKSLQSELSKVTSVSLLEQVFSELPNFIINTKHTHMVHACWFEVSKIQGLKFHRKHISEKALALECATIVIQDGLLT
jgi:hypothetical protein